MQIGNRFRKVPEGCGPMKFRMVPVQIADKVAKKSGAASGAYSKQISGTLLLKKKRISKLLGIIYMNLFLILRIN